MIDAGNVWGENIYTMKDGTTKNGRYFGTTAVPPEADQDKYVFLPAAGNRGLFGYNSDGTHSNYWSATPNSSSTRNAYYLDFTSSNCNVYLYDRTHGFSLRCVRNK